MPARSITLSGGVGARVFFDSLKTRAPRALRAAGLAWGWGVGGEWPSSTPVINVTPRQPLRAVGSAAAPGTPRRRRQRGARARAPWVPGHRRRRRPLLTPPAPLYPSFADVLTQYVNRDRSKPYRHDAGKTAAIAAAGVLLGLPASNALYSQMNATWPSAAAPVAAGKFVADQALGCVLW